MVGSINSGFGFRGNSSYDFSSKTRKAAGELFGNNSVQNVFAINSQFIGSSGPQVDQTQLLTNGLQREIDSLLGYRTNLSVAEKQELAGYQEDIEEINALAQERVLTENEISKRADLYAESYALLGKPYVDVNANPEFKDLAARIDEVLATKPQGAQAKRLEQLETMRDRMTERSRARGDNVSETLQIQLRNLYKQIAELTRPREIKDLSLAERKEYDELVDRVNKGAGSEVFLPSEKKNRVEKLQATIAAVQAGDFTALSRYA